MTLEELKVVISAEIEPLKKGMEYMKKSLKGVEKETANITSGIAGKFKNLLKSVILLKIGQKIAQSIIGGLKDAMNVEAAIQQIKRIMGESSQQFLKWADTQAIAFNMSKSQAVRYGSIFGNLVRGFSKDSAEAMTNTTELLKASSIIASATGRTMEDVMERIRSGLLGNTEAIEDLGVNVNVAMIESTDAFKKFANGKSWNQLSFQTQQQIRLMAILEQTNKNYGDSVSNNTSTQLAQLVANLNNVKLALGQAFLPIAQIILPLLNQLAQGLAYVMGIFAQFMQALFGKPAQVKQQSNNISNQGKAVGGLGKQYEGAGKKAKKAGKEFKGALAGFDEITTLNLKDPTADSEAGAGGGVAGAAGLPGMGGITPLDFSTNALEISPKIQAMAEQVKKVVGDIKDFISRNKDIIISAVAGIVAAFASFQIISNWGSIVKGISIAFQALGAAIGGISWPIVGIAALIGLLVGNIVYLWRTNEDFRNSVLEVWQQIKDFILKVIEDIGTIVTELWDKYGKSLVENLKGFMKSVQDLIVNVWENFIKPIIKNALEMLQWLWDKHLKDLVKEVGDFVLNLVNSALEIWNKFISPLVNWLVKVLGPIFADIINGIVNTWGDKVAMFIDIAKGIFKVLGGIIDFIMGVFAGDWEKAWRGIMKILEGIWDGAVGVVKYPLNLIIDAINTVISGLNRVKFDVPDWVPFVGGKSFAVNIKPIQKLAKGGIVDRPTTALIGEAGTEAVVPLENNTGGLQLLADKLMERIGGNNPSSGGDLVLMIDSSVIGRVALNQLRRMQRQGNITLIPT